MGVFTVILSHSSRDEVYDSFVTRAMSCSIVSVKLFVITE